MTISQLSIRLFAVEAALLALALACFGAGTTESLTGITDKRVKECLLDVPAVLKPPTNSAVIQSELLAQFRNAGRNASHSYDSVMPVVPALSERSSPHDVFNFIIPVVIHSFELPSLFTGAHIFDKSCERFSPSATHFDPTAPIIFIVHASFRLASLNHTAPNCINVSTTGTMPEIPCGRYISAQTTAGFGIPGFQSAVIDNLKRTAFTTAQTSRVLIASLVDFWNGFRDNMPSSECFSDEAGLARFRLGSNVVLHRRCSVDLITLILPAGRHNGPSAPFLLA